MAMELLPALRFRFGDPEDVAAYGDGWWVYDEAALAALRARDLVALEAATGVPLVDVMEGMRVRTTVGQLAAMWIAMHRAGQTVPWDDFDPLVFDVRWEEVPAVPLEGPDSTESPTADSPSSPAPAGASGTSS